MEDYLQGICRIGFYLQEDRAPEESAVVQRTEIHTLPAARSLYSPSLLWLDQTSHDAPYTNLTCCPATHLAVL